MRSYEKLNLVEAKRTIILFVINATKKDTRAKIVSLLVLEADRDPLCPMLA